MNPLNQHTLYINLRIYRVDPKVRENMSPKHAQLVEDTLKDALVLIVIIKHAHAVLLKQIHGKPSKKAFDASRVDQISIHISIYLHIYIQRYVCVYVFKYI